MSTTPEDIQAQIYREDIEPYNNSIYDGYMPELFPEYFKKALMCIPPTEHKYDLQLVKKILSTRVGEYTMVQITIMINLVYSTPWNQIYPDLDTAMEITMEFDKVKEINNQRTKEMEIKCIKKRNRLMQITGNAGKTGKLIVS